MGRHLAQLGDRLETVSGHELALSGLLGPLRATESGLDVGQVSVGGNLAR